MSEHAPDALLLVQKHAAYLIDQNRRNLRALLADEDDAPIFRPASVQALYRASRIAADPGGLADLLCGTTPAQIVDLGWTDPPKQHADLGPDKAGNLFKMRQAVLESALVEQLCFNKTFRKGEAFSAAACEAALDDWVRAGRHRGAAFEDAPLSQIAMLVESTVHDAQAQVETRLGLVVPVLAAVHIWRSLEEMPTEKTQTVGWSDQPLHEFEKELAHDTHAN